MKQRKAKSKGKNRRPIYPGVLGQRSDDESPLPPPTTVLGEPTEASLRQYRQCTDEWAQRQASRAIEGMRLLCEHYGIADDHQKYFNLAWALARDHVPYFMEPAPGRGRPATLAHFLPLIDTMLRGRKAGWPVTNDMIYDLFLPLVGASRETVERELRRFRRGKKNTNFPTAK